MAIVARCLRRQGLAALAAAALGCTAQPMQAPATTGALAALAAAVRHDVYGRPVALAPLLKDRAVLYFFRSDCPHCATAIRQVRVLAGRPGVPPLILISREGAARLRAVLGPAPTPGLLAVSDSDGAVMRLALPTWYVPRIVAVAGSRIVLDRTGAAGPGLAHAAAATAP